MRGFMSHPLLLKLNSSKTPENKVCFLSLQDEFNKEALRSQPTDLYATDSGRQIFWQPYSTIKVCKRLGKLFSVWRKHS